jgi:hypothetical protein
MHCTCRWIDRPERERGHLLVYGWLHWEALLQNLVNNNVTYAFLLNPEAPVQSYKRYVGFGVDFRGLCNVSPYSSSRPGIPATNNTKSYRICHVKSQIIQHKRTSYKTSSFGSFHFTENKMKTYYKYRKTHWYCHYAFYVGLRRGP